FLAADRADATMADAVSMQRIIEKYDDPPVAAIGLNGRITGKRASYGEMIDPFDVAFGLPKGDNGWRGCVNAWVQDLLDSGRMGRRLDYWLAQPLAWAGADPPGPARPGRALPARRRRAL